MVKAAYFDKNGVKKGAWTEEEDNKLRAYVLRYGHWNWRLLPKFAGLERCGKSCRLRWMNYLKPGVKRGNYSEEERDLIAQLHREFGNKWSAIAARLPGRTDNDIKNYWHTRVKKPEKSSSKSGQQADICQEKQFSQVSHCSDDLEKAVAGDAVAASVAPKVRSGKLVDSELATDHNFVLESSTESDSGNANWESGSTSVDLNCSRKARDHFVRPLPINAGATDDLFSGFDESFWTQPFMVDTYSYNYDSNFCVLDEGAFLSPNYLSWFDDNGISML